jgi:hypothetical protein
MIPYTDHECRLALEELYRGDKVVLPSSIEHAEFMLMVAQAYIKEDKQRMWSTLGHDSNPTA